MASTKNTTGTHSKAPLSYRDAGVDIDAGDALVERIKPHVKRTTRPEVMGGLGGFGALFELPLERYRKPVLVSGTDGVGTKLKLAIETGIHDTIGIDLVAMCANDLIVQGAEPLFFLDYYASGQLKVDVAEKVIKGICDGCVEAGMSLIGGETAEMPGLYAPGDYDLAGFCVGIVEKEHIITGTTVSAGDTVIALPSSGPHSNGYSLIRKILERQPGILTKDFDGRSYAQVLLAPTRIYVKPILNLIKEVPVKAIAHITGGGLIENIPRVIPDHLAVHLQTNSWTQAPIFTWLQQQGNIEQREMWRTFNCGIGLVLCVAAQDTDRTLNNLRKNGEKPFVVGTINAREADAVVFI